MTEYQHRCGGGYVAIADDLHATAIELVAVHGTGTEAIGGAGIWPRHCGNKLEVHMRGWCLMSMCTIVMLVPTYEIDKGAQHIRCFISHLLV